MIQIPRIFHMLYKRYIFYIYLIIIYISSRLLFLSRYPIFNDEAIHLRFGQIIWQSGYWQYSMMHSGKQPLPYIVYGAMMKIISDPLFAGRIVSIVFGFCTLFMVIAVSYRSFNKKTSIVAGLLYIICPITLFFDRLVVVDVMLSFIYVCQLYVLIQCIKNPKNISILAIIILGVLSGIGLWIKTTGVILFISTGILWIVFVRNNRKRIPILELILLCSIALCIALPYIVQPEFTRVISLLSDHSYGVIDTISNLLSSIPGKIYDFVLIFIGYVTPISILVFIWYLIYRNTITKRFLLLALFLPIFLMLPEAKVFQSRYILFTVPIILIMCADFFITLHNWYINIIMIVCMCILSMILIQSPPSFFHIFPSFRVWGAEQSQYIDSWTSGYGVMNAIDFVKKNINGKKAIVYVRWDSGNPEDTVLLYGPKAGLLTLYLDKSIPIPSIYSAISSEIHSYLITRRAQTSSYNAEYKILQSFPKPFGDERVDVYRVKFK
jgi:4-amino-4-deoxy-L-arabinose transferase-like glycosyltransferase